MLAEPHILFGVQKEIMPNWNKILNGFNVTDKEYCIYRDDKDGNEVEIMIVLAGSGLPYHKGYTSGPPEKCYPAEGGYCEDVTAFDPKTGSIFDLTKDEESRAQEYLWELYCDQREANTESYFDYPDNDPFYD